MIRMAGMMSERTPSFMIRWKDQGTTRSMPHLVGGGAVRGEKSAKNVLVLDQELDQPN